MTIEELSKTLDAKNAPIAVDIIIAILELKKEVKALKAENEALKTDIEKILENGGMKR